MNKKTLLLFSATVLGSTATYAQTTWTGNISTSFSTAGNWTNGAPGFNGTATFSGSSATNQPDILGANKTGLGLDFQSAGWTVNDSVGGAYIRMDGTSASANTNLSSVGAGVNTINANVSGSGGGILTVNVGAGNTLVSNGDWINGNDKNFTGTGTFVLNGTNSANNTGVIGFSDAMTLMVNGAGGVYSGTVNNGGKVTGTGTISVFNYQTLTFGDTGILTAGGDGTFGNEIGTLTFDSTTTARAEMSMDAGSIAELQIGSGGVGDNDKIALDLSGGRLAINAGASLNILGSVIEDGTYTLFENIGTSNFVTGTFTNLLFNGVAMDPENFTLNYNGTSSITLDVSGLAAIPEASAFALILGGAAFMLTAKRRRVRSC